MVTEKEVLQLKKEVDEGKQKYIQAQATLAEVEKNIEAYKSELKALGVEPDTVQDWLKSEEDAINNLYQEAKSKFPKS